MIYVLSCHGGQYDDKWERPIAASQDRNKVEAYKRECEQKHRTRRNLNDFLIALYEDIQKVHPRPNWDSKEWNHDYEAYYEAEDKWRVKYWNPLYLATLYLNGLTWEKEEDFIPEGHEIRIEGVWFDIDEVKEI